MIDLKEEYYFEYMEELSYKHYQQTLRRYPDCRDPDHPECELCREEENEED